MIFTTKNSRYELDKDSNRIRRLNGNNAPLDEQGPDGEWKEFMEIVVNGGRVSIFYTDGSWVVTSNIVDWDVADSSD